MHNYSIQRTEELAPILRGLESQLPDYQDLATRLLTYFGQKKLALVLAKREQDWKAIFETQKAFLKDEPCWVRIQTILNALTDQPQDQDELAQKTGINKVLISQTISALSRGGYEVGWDNIPGGITGRPKKMFFSRQS